jgi:hypothetical protein
MIRLRDAVYMLIRRAIPSVGMEGVQAQFTGRWLLLPNTNPHPHAKPETHDDVQRP